MRRAHMPSQIDQADRVWPGQAGPAAPAGIAPLRCITISPWRFHCLWLFSIPFTTFAEEPTNWVRLTPAVISNFHEGKKLSDHFGVVSDFSDQHYQIALACCCEK